jgi:hypothetical protein
MRDRRRDRPRFLSADFVENPQKHHKCGARSSRMNQKKAPPVPAGTPGDENDEAM